MRHDVIIIGGGQAGSMLSIALRQNKYSGSILLVSNECHIPYQRPPLSKNFLTDNTSIESLYFKSSSYYKKNQIDMLLNSHVISINKGRKSISLKEGKELYYDKLVIATGSKLNKVGLKSANDESYLLKTIDDSVKIRSLLDKQQEIAIVGAGYIGLEIAAAAIKKNNRVVIIEADSRVMSRSVCPETSQFYESIHKKEGVKFFFNSLVKDIDQNNNEKIISLDSHESIKTEQVIVGVGVKPRVKIALEADLDCRDGILVNEFCQTSDDSIYAIGDCANYPNSIYNLRLRLESVQNAIEHAKIAAAKISETELANHQIPWFWSDQYDIKLRIAGINMGYENYVFRGNIDEEKFSVFYMKEDRIIAVETINDNKSFALSKKLIKDQVSIPLDVIKDKDSDLKIFLNEVV